MPDPGRIEALAGHGLTVGEIARVFGLDEVTLRRSFAPELSSGSLKANARVAESLYRKAIGEGRESVTAAIFLLKTRARWREHSVHEFIARKAEIAAMSDAELEAEILRLNARINQLIRPAGDAPPPLALAPAEQPSPQRG